MIQFFETDIDWVRGLNFENNLLDERTDAIRCGVVNIEELDCTVFHFLAPLDTGLWWFRQYEAFEAGLQSFFGALQNEYVRNTLPEDHFKKLPLSKFYKRHGIPKRSAHAFDSFGVYPRLWGNTFAPKNGHNGLIHGRYASVAVPKYAAKATRQYFVQQSLEFGDHCTATASEDRRLWNAGLLPDDDYLLLCGGPNTSNHRELSKWLERLEQLCSNKSERDEFASQLDVGVKFAGAVMVDCGRQYLWEKRIKEFPIFVEVLKARVKLICILGWPPFLDYARSSLLHDEWRESPVNHMLADVEAALNRYPVVRVNPLQLASL